MFSFAPHSDVRWENIRGEHQVKQTITMKCCINSFLFLILPFQLLSQESKIYDSLSFKSTILKKEEKFSIYLPSGYQTSLRSYPVVYLLHGGGGSYTDWIRKGDMQHTVDSGIQRGKIEAMIVVMPDAERTYYMNNINGKYQFEDFFMKELIPYIEKNYRCRKEKTYRAVAGFSMGGYGSLLYSVHHPELFSACAAISAGIRTDEEIKKMPLEEFLLRYRTALGELKEGDNRITEFWNQNSVLYLINRMPEEQKKAVRFYLDIGDDDTFYKGNSLLHIAMRDLNIPHEYRVRDGAHIWEYARTGLADALSFISESFH